jgi:hypothetical protein
VRLLVCGDRNWQEPEVIRTWLDRLRPEVVIEGEATGADELAREAAWSLGIPVLGYPAQWDKYGKAAGLLRNQQMIDYGHPTHVLAFHANIDASRGTRDMVVRARRAALPVRIVARPDDVPPTGAMFVYWEKAK